MRLLRDNPKSTEQLAGRDALARVQVIGQADYLLGKMARVQQADRANPDLPVSSTISVGIRR